MQMREKVGKSRNTAFFQWFVAPEGRKVGSLQRRVRSHVVRWEMKSCTPMWREARFQVKMYKAHHVRTTFGSWDVEKVDAVVARSTFPSQNVKSTTCSDRFWRFRCGFAWHARDSAPCQKWAKREGFVVFSKTMAGVGHFEEDLQRCIFRGRRSTRDMFIRDVRMSEHWFPERGCILEHQILSFGKVILRDRCSTSASLLRGRRNTLDRWSGKIAKRIGTRPSALHPIFQFWRTSRRIVSFLMLSTSKIEEVSQNCSVFDVVKFKSWGSLADLFRFWRCQVQLPSSKTEEVSQNCFVFDVAKFKNWGSLVELLRFQAYS